MDQFSQVETVLSVDLDEYERNLREILFELQRTRGLSDEYRKELNESILKQQDLERQLLNEKNKNSNDEMQNIVLRNAVETLEQERQKCNKDLIKTRVQFELAVAERDSLRDQARSQCIEINNLKQQVDDLASKYKCHKNFEKLFLEQLGKVKNSTNQINDLINPLRETQEELKQLLGNNNCEQLLLTIKQLNQHKNKFQNEKHELEKQLVIKNAEISKLKDLLENFPIFQNTFENTTILDYWKENCKELKSQLKSEKDGNEKLTNALKLSHEHEEFLRLKKMKNEEKITELEERLQKIEVKKFDVEVQTKIAENCTETIDLVKSESSEQEFP